MEVSAHASNACVAPPAPHVYDLPPRAPDGHPKLLHLWPVKLLQAGRGDYGDSVVVAMREAASFSR